MENRIIAQDAKELSVGVGWRKSVHRIMEREKR
jgi:hypothetical protein